MMAVVQDYCGDGQPAMGQWHLECLETWYLCLDWKVVVCRTISSLILETENQGEIVALMFKEATRGGS